MAEGSSGTSNPKLVTEPPLPVMYRVPLQQVLETHACFGSSTCSITMMLQMLMMASRIPLHISWLTLKGTCIVRGDRSVTAFNQPATTTILRSYGKVYCLGADLISSSIVAPNKFQSVGNPYASAIGCRY